MELGKELLILGLISLLGKSFSECQHGFHFIDKCVDIDECNETSHICGLNTTCFNTAGSYYCQCKAGFQHSQGKQNFTGLEGQCKDINECQTIPSLCKPNTTCVNTAGSYYCQCKAGFQHSQGKLNFTGLEGQCEDINECQTIPSLCGPNSTCVNTNGSYYCQCKAGFHHSQGKLNFTGLDGQCEDINECQTIPSLCGPNTKCFNTSGSYYCQCESGFHHSQGKLNFTGLEGQCEDVDECEDAGRNKERLCGETGTCKNVIGSYWCECPTGFTNYGVQRMSCSGVNCDSFSDHSGAAQSLAGLAAMLSMMKSSCLALTNSNGSSETKADGEALLEKISTAADAVLSTGLLTSEKHVNGLLSTMESAIRLIGPQLKHNRSKMETSQTETEIAVQRGKSRPTGPVHLTNQNAAVDTDWTTASGTGSYPGFALAALLTYKNLELSVNRSFELLKGHNGREDDAAPSFKVFSKVVSVVVSNPSTQQLDHPVTITLRHLEDKNKTPEIEYVCAYWHDSGAWSTDGCYWQFSNVSHTVCRCEHLSSFAVLMALYPMEHTFGLLLVSKLGLSISLLCLVLCILTFKFCRSIKGTRTTIHLHLCICLFMADLIFLAGISQTKPEGGCRFVAAMLHFFFLGVFAWMLLEGVQLYRMVVLVFNATIRPLYLFIIGYGTPLVVVILSAIIKPTGYGTDEHCWLSLENGFIWSFLGPVCFIIFVNVFFFIITVWKLAQKFTSLNPDLSTLHKIKAFTVTAIAQMCILGLMWVFGTFLFQKNNIVGSYIFSILNSLQGALVFIMHCLLSKQVREEYARFFSCICEPEKRYSGLSSSNPSSSSQSQGSRSGRHTGNTQI